MKTNKHFFILEKKNQHPDILQRAKINIISRQKCNKWLKGKVTAQMLCAGEPQGQKDACTVSKCFYFNLIK